MMPTRYLLFLSLIIVCIYFVDVDPSASRQGDLGWLQRSSKIKGEMEGELMAS